jgi:hypothetical protein
MVAKVEFYPLELYRYRVATPGFRTGPNCYPRVRMIGPGPRGAWIGWYIVLGRYAYCVKWGWAR